MAKYRVDVPLAGYLTIVVEADSAEDAINTALATDFDITAANGAECAEANLYEVLAEGNVLHAPLNRAHAEKVDDDEDDD